MVVTVAVSSSNRQWVFDISVAPPIPQQRVLDASADELFFGSSIEQPHEAFKLLS